MAEIRPYSPNDYPQIQRNMMEAGVYYDVRDSQKNLDAMAAADPDLVLVARDGDQIIGSILSSPLGINIACAWGLAVPESHRRRGIATELVSKLSELLKAKGVIEIWGFVNIDNEASQGFLESVGFEFNRDNTYFGPWLELKTIKPRV